MHINKNCQICEVKPREQMILHDIQRFCLCSSCATAGIFKDGTRIAPAEQYRLHRVHLKDIKERPEPGRGSYQKAFFFEPHDGERLYLKVPGLFSGYSHCAVLDMKTREVIRVGHDMEIKIVDWDTASPMSEFV